MRATFTWQLADLTFLIDPGHFEPWYWIVSGDCTLLCLDSISVGSKPMVALSLAELPGHAGHLVLAMGGLDNKIHLYYGENTGNVCSP